MLWNKFSSAKQHDLLSCLVSEVWGSGSSLSGWFWLRGLLLGCRQVAAEGCSHQKGPRREDVLPSSFGGLLSGSVGSFPCELCMLTSPRVSDLTERVTEREAERGEQSCTAHHHASVHSYVVSNRDNPNFAPVFFSSIYTMITDPILFTSSVPFKPLLSVRLHTGCCCREGNLGHQPSSH